MKKGGKEEKTIFDRVKELAELDTIVFSVFTSVKATHSSPSGPALPNTKFKKVESRLIAGLVGFKSRPSGILYQGGNNM